MKLGRWTTAAAAIVFATACSKAPAPLNDAERAAIADSVSQMTTQFLAGMAQPTPEFYLSHFTGNDWVHAEYGMVYPTYDSTVKVVRATLRPGTSMKVTFSQKHVTVLDRDVVVFTALMNGTMKDSAGTEMPFNEAWMAVYHRTTDGWKIAADHESTAPSAPEPVKPKHRAR